MDIIIVFGPKGPLYELMGHILSSLMGFIIDLSSETSTSLFYIYIFHTTTLKIKLNKDIHSNIYLYRYKLHYFLS